VSRSDNPRTLKKIEAGAITILVTTGGGTRAASAASDAAHPAETNRPFEPQPSPLAVAGVADARATRSPWGSAVVITTLAALTRPAYALGVMIAESIPQLRSLSSDEKILLAAELWREAIGVEEDAPSPQLVAALRERLAYHREHPEEVSTWEEVRARILSTKSSPRG